MRLNVTGALTARPLAKIFSRNIFHNLCYANNINNLVFAPLQLAEIYEQAVIRM